MELSLTRNTTASAASIWRVFIEIDHAAERISGIEHIDIIEAPENGLVGLKWLETRRMHGRKSTAELQMTHIKSGRLVEVESYAAGCRFLSKLMLHDKGEQRIIEMSFKSFPNNFFSKLIMRFIGQKMLNSMKTLIEQDLLDIDIAATALDKVEQ